ncbi:MAG: hypothetical protein NZ874_03045 [Fimbriimonadales bacterium]|nr:hypothetical protein [Fimbriimonadales bacterium]
MPSHRRVGSRLQVWHGHLARACVARTVVSVQRSTDSRVRAPVGADADATAWTRLSKPLCAWARRSSHSVARASCLCSVARTVVSVPPLARTPTLQLGHDCPSHVVLGRDAQATSWHGHLARACVAGAQRSKPRPSARRRRYPVGILQTT